MQREPIETCDLFLKLFCEMSLSGEINSAISVVYFAQHLGVFTLKRVNFVLFISFKSNLNCRICSHEK